MKNLVLLSSLFTWLILTMMVTPIRAQSYQYATSLEAQGSFDVLVVRSVDTDAIGNSYATGYFEGSVNAPNGLISSTIGSQDIFVSKFDTGGNLIWFIKAGGNSEDGSNDISVETFGNGSFFITGYVKFAGTVSFFKQVGSITLVPSTGSVGSAKQGFIAKYDLNGNAIWVKPINTTTSYTCNVPQESEGISLVASYRHTNGMNFERHVYVTGYFSGDLGHFQNSNGSLRTILGHGGSLIAPCGFTAKFNGTNGGAMWAQSMAANGSSFSMGKSIDVGNPQNFGSGRLYVFGDFDGTGNFGGNTMTNGSGNTEAFIFSSNGANGSGYWANKYSATNGDANAREVSIEQSNTDFFCVIGDFRGSALSYTGGGSGNSNGGRDVFISKINATNGSISVFKVFGGMYDQYGSGLVMERQNGIPDVFISGVFNQQLTFDNGQQINTLLPGQFENDHFFARLDNNLDILCYDSWDADMLLDINLGEARIDANKVCITKGNTQAVIGGMFFDNETPTFNFTSLSSTSSVGSFVSLFACCDCPPPSIDVQRDALGTNANLYFTYPNCSSSTPSMFQFYFQELPTGQFNPLGLPWGTTVFTMSNLMAYPTMYNWFTQSGCTSSPIITKNVEISETIGNDMHMTAFPNPSQGLIKIVFEKSEINRSCIIKVTDQYGRIILEQEKTADMESSTLDFTQFESGVYLIHAELQDKTEILRVIKE